MRGARPGETLAALNGRSYALEPEMTVIADNYNGQPLNSPNDIAPHKDGSIWFTDPYYGAQLAEGHPDDGVSFLNPKGLANGNDVVGRYLLHHTLVAASIWVEQPINSHIGNSGAVISSEASVGKVPPNAAASRSVP